MFFVFPNDFFDGGSVTEDNKGEASRFHCFVVVDYVGVFDFAELFEIFFEFFISDIYRDSAYKDFAFFFSTEFDKCLFFAEVFADFEVSASEGVSLGEDGAVDGKLELGHGKAF